MRNGAETVKMRAEHSAEELQGGGTRNVVLRDNN
jgi:hypothetical protein